MTQSHLDSSAEQRRGGAPQDLTFGDLRAANVARQEHWGGSENWTLADWSNAVAGEVGEACNVVKKIRRPQLGTIGNNDQMPAYFAQLESEIGDVLIYLDLLANAAGFGLGTCVMRAFNEKSAKLGMPVHLLPVTPASIRTDALSPEDVFYVSSTASFTDGNNRKVTVLDVVEYGDRFANSWEPRRGILCDLTPDGDAWVLFRDTRKVEVVKWMNLCKVPAIDEAPPYPTKDKDNGK